MDLESRIGCSAQRQLWTLPKPHLPSLRRHGGYHQRTDKEREKKVQPDILDDVSASPDPDKNHTFGRGGPFVCRAEDRRMVSCRSDSERVYLFFLWFLILEPASEWSLVPIRMDHFEWSSHPSGFRTIHILSSISLSKADGSRR